MQYYTPDHLCAESECSAQSTRRGLCKKHYRRRTMAGTLPPLRTVEDRFFSYLDCTDPERCWLWTGSRYADGYGMLMVHKKVKKTHRVSWELHNGSIPDDLCVLHSCDVPACCNPAHLFLGTQVENIADRHRKGRSARAPKIPGRQRRVS